MRFVSGFLIGGILGTLAGAGAMLVAFPYIFKPPMVNEIVDQAGAELVVASSFRQNVAGHDPAHWGRGDVKLYRTGDGNYLLEFQANFEVGPGPNLWLYVNTADNIDQETDFLADKRRVRITKIKSFEGSQVYKLTVEQMQDAKAVTVWCETFGQYIASANLTSDKAS